eukprot:4229412-Karenia_brevis.AAC.1
MASKARGALRLGGGRWLDVFASDSQGASCKVYINPDVSPQVARIQTATKRIHGVITELYPALRVSYTKPAFHPKTEPQGVVTANGVDIVAIKAPNAFDEIDVFWAPAEHNQTQAEKLGVSKLQVSQLFEERATASSKPGVDTSMWCK